MGVMLLLLMMMVFRTGGRVRIGDGIGRSRLANDIAVLVELDGAGERAGAGRRREGAAGGKVALLLVRVLF
jgi:hypothetical protein